MIKRYHVQRSKVKGFEEKYCKKNECQHYSPTIKCKPITEMMQYGGSMHITVKQGIVSCAKYRKRQPDRKKKNPDQIWLDI